MLMYYPDLRRESIHELAKILVECNLLSPGEVEQTVDECVERLAQRYGLKLHEDVT